MKNFKETVTKKCLSISYDEASISPREDSNLGYFISIDSKYYSPDRNDIFKEIIKDTGENASDQKDHMERIKEDIEEMTSDKVIALYPITMFEHGAVKYNLGQASGFDSSNNSFYIVTEESQKDMGAEKKDFEKIIKNELENYNAYVNGEMYKFELKDQSGEIVEFCTGLYKVEDVREYLPEEYKDDDLNDYFIN